MLEKHLDRRRLEGNLRELKTRSDLIDFASNDYLGLTQSKELKLAVLREWEDLDFALGSTGSRLLTGNTHYACELEMQIASYHGYEEGLIFSCGYLANLGLLSSLANEENTIIFDAHIHASVRDGIRLSKAHAFPFKHNDLDHLEERLKKHGNSRCYLCIESIYSMDGSKAPIREISQLSQKYGVRLIVDEAHAVGIWGPGGRGVVAEYGLMDQIYAQVVTFGKALGGYGAIVLGNKKLKQYLINFARSCVYTTALPPHTLAMIKCAYGMLTNLDRERSHLYRLIERIQKTFKTDSETAIQPFQICGNAAVRQAAHFLEERGFDVRPLLSPTVQLGHEILRVCLHAFNTEEQVITLMDYLKLWIK